MPVLVGRCCAFMQSWSISGRMQIIDSGSETSKSGLIGVLCNAAGIPRHRDDIVERLAMTEMAVRVDRPGSRLCDYHTVSGFMTEDGSYQMPLADGETRNTPAITYRNYIIDGEFLVFLEGPSDLLGPFNEAIIRPVRAYYFGRKCCIPSLPMGVSTTLFPGTIDEALAAIPWRSRRGEKRPGGPLRIVRDSLRATNDVRMDVPLTFRHNAEIRFGQRCVTTSWIRPPRISENPVCSFTG